ncbi:tetraspanin-9-like [Etheostoma cragini]|uniref:tetraspanin-9-like n=1 Tax=Etheostoma cragini TaxID=417921 RepID=UPI00155E7523|nr:tetraspanin-9-like [Etheostoma cragini]
MTQVNCCLKWLLTIFNIIFAIVGVGVIVVALMVQFHIADENFPVEFNPSCLYVLGSIVMVIAILGAVGACNENKACMVLVSTKQRIQSSTFSDSDSALWSDKIDDRQTPQVVTPQPVLRLLDAAGGGVGALGGAVRAFLP